MLVLNNTEGSCFVLSVLLLMLLVLFFMRKAVFIRTASFAYAGGSGKFTFYADVSLSYAGNVVSSSSSLVLRGTVSDGPSLKLIYIICGRFLFLVVGGSCLMLKVCYIGLSPSSSKFNARVQQNVYTGLANGSFRRQILIVPAVDVAAFRSFSVLACAFTRFCLLVSSASIPESLEKSGIARHASAASPAGDALGSTAPVLYSAVLTA